MKKVVIISLLTIGVVASIALNGAIASTQGDATTADIVDIAGSPSEMDGQEVTVEGLVGFTMDHQFVLWDDGVTSTIMVKCIGDTPTDGMVYRVRVTGTVGIERLLGHEQAYIFARSWEYKS